MAEWRRRTFRAPGLTQAPPGPHLDALARRAGRTVPLYTSWAGQNVVLGVRSDRYGNAEGSGYDLVEDGSVSDATILALTLYDLDFAAPRHTLERKGFTVVEHRGAVSGNRLEALLRDANQLWVISSLSPGLAPDALEVIEDFFRRGHGLYVWGDNDPYFGEANQILRRLFGVAMSGNSPGDRVVTMRRDGEDVGLTPGHLITTGLVNVYEGYTVAEVPTGESLRPLINGSNGRVVAAYHDRNGCRAIADGGFTRLYMKWNSAGTDRYIANAAAWLLNLERAHLDAPAG